MKIRTEMMCRIAENCKLLTGTDMDGKQYKDARMIEFDKVSEITRNAEKEFIKKCMDLATKNWCDSQVKMIQTLFESVIKGCEYKCVNCQYFGKPSDAPGMADERCMWEESEVNENKPPCTGKKMTIGIDVEGLREELSRGCEYSGTQEVVHQNFYEAMEELGGTGDWDEMAAEDIEGQMCVLQPLFEIFYDKTVEKILNYIDSYNEEE